MKNVAAVIVTYNRKHLLERCVELLLEQKGAVCDVVVVDNASTDGTAEMIREKFCLDTVIYENTGANLGGAGGFQYGLRSALRLGYEYIWIMDDDTLPENTALAELLKADKILAGKWGFLSSAAYWTDGSICKANRQKKNVFVFVKDCEFENALIPVQFGSFVSLFVKSSIVKEVGLPIGEYFIWTDDYEFCGRISKRYPCYVVPASKVIHAMKGNMKANVVTDSMERVERYKCLFRNDVHCYRQFGLWGWMYIIFKDAYTTIKIIFKSKGEKLQRLKAVFCGFTAGLQFHPVVEQVNDERELVRTDGYQNGNQK